MKTLRTITAALFGLALLASLCSCVGGARAMQSQAAPVPAAAQPTSQPAGNPHSQAQSNQQSGTVNAAGQMDASGWTGLAISSVLPWGVTVLVSLFAILLTWTSRKQIGSAMFVIARSLELVTHSMDLSHAREMKRLELFATEKGRTEP